MCLFYFFSHIYVSTFHVQNVWRFLWRALLYTSAWNEIYIPFLIVSSDGFQMCTAVSGCLLFWICVLSIPTLNYTYLFIYTFFFKLQVCDNNILHLFSLYVCTLTCVTVPAWRSEDNYRRQFSHWAMWIRVRAEGHGRCLYTDPCL